MRHGSLHTCPTSWLSMMLSSKNGWWNRKSICRGGKRSESYSIAIRRRKKNETELPLYHYGCAHDISLSDRIRAYEITSVFQINSRHCAGTFFAYRFCHTE